MFNYRRDFSTFYKRKSELKQNRKRSHMLGLVVREDLGKSAKKWSFREPAG